MLQMLCNPARAADLIGQICTGGGYYYCHGLKITSITVNWTGFTPGAHVRILTASGFELTTIYTLPNGTGSVTYGDDLSGAHIIRPFDPTFAAPTTPNAVIYDLRAAYAVIDGDPQGIHYAANGGRVITETDIFGGEGCCSHEEYTEDALVYNISGRVASVSDENQTKECDLNTGCSACSKGPMASYSIHLLLASLHIEDTPISYNSARGPSTDFKVVYNQREANQPTTFLFSNWVPNGPSTGCRT